MITDPSVAVFHAVVHSQGIARTVGSQLAGLLMANAMYSAYSFYQGRKGAPLTEDEMADIHQGVLNEIVRYTQQYADVLTSSDEE